MGRSSSRGRPFSNLNSSTPNPLRASSVSSEVLIVVTGVIAVSVTMLAWWTLFPLIFDLNEADKCQAAFNVNTAAVCEKTYQMMGILPPVAVGGIFVSLFMRSARRQSDEVTE